MSEIPKDKNLVVVMGRSTAKLHGLVFRNVSNSPVSAFSKQRLEKLAEFYEKLSGAGTYNNTDGDTYNNTLPYDGAAVELIREINDPIEFENDHRPVIFELIHTRNDGRSVSARGNTLWEFFQSCKKACGRVSNNKDLGDIVRIENCGLPAGVFDFLASAGAGDSVTYTLTRGGKYTINIV